MKSQFLNMADEQRFKFLNIFKLTRRRTFRNAILKIMLKT